VGLFKKTKPKHKLTKTHNTEEFIKGKGIMNFIDIIL